MKITKILMGMPITVRIIDGSEKNEAKKADTISKVFDYFGYIDAKFSPFKDNSELTLINTNKIKPRDYSADMKLVLRLCEKTRKESDGYFDIRMPGGKIDTSGLVKGWAINNAAKIIKRSGFKNYYVDAGGDIQTSGFNENNTGWKVGIRNPFNNGEIIKVISVSGEGVATSGTYERGEHIYDPLTLQKANEVISITVIGPDIYDADRFATAAFAMGVKGLEFIEKLSGFEAYMIDRKSRAYFSEGFNKYISN